METQDGLKTIALILFLNLFFYFLLQLHCVMISHWLTVLKHKIPRQILFLKAIDVKIAGRYYLRIHYYSVLTKLGAWA